MNVLVVAREPQLRARLGKLLEDKGHVAVWASTYEGARRLLRLDGLDVVILEESFDLSAYAQGRPVIILHAPFEPDLISRSLELALEVFRRREEEDL